MGRFFDALKAGVAGFKEGTEPREYSVARGRCDARTVERRSSRRVARSSTRVASPPSTWTGQYPSASILVCAECGRIEWFVREPVEISS